MTASRISVAVKHLQMRVDALENALCELYVMSPEWESITRYELKKALQDAKILGKQGSK